MSTAVPFEDLVAAAQSGSDRAVAELYRQFNPKLLRYLEAQAPGDGEDLASETWLAAARNLRRFSGGPDDFAGWLHTIARRRLVDHWRARGRRPVAPLDDVTLARRARPVDGAEDTALANGLAEDEARRLVAWLPPDQAEIVLLRVVAGLDVETVAAITGRRAGTIRVIQHRALRRLARALDGEHRPRSSAPGPATEPTAEEV